MLYKVTPMLSPPQKAKPAEPTAPGADKAPRKRRKSAVFDADGNEVLITMMCLKCRAMKPLAMFGLRKMADGAIRNQPWCRTCRSGASPKKKKDEVDSVEAEVPSAEAPAVLQADAVPAAAEVAQPSGPTSTARVADAAAEPEQRAGAEASLPDEPQAPSSP